jgi:hypothetical protein
MDMWGHELVVYLGFGKELSESGRGCIVEVLKGWV